MGSLERELSLKHRHQSMVLHNERHVLLIVSESPATRKLKSFGARKADSSLIPRLKKALEAPCDQNDNCSFGGPPPRRMPETCGMQWPMRRLRCVLRIESGAVGDSRSFRYAFGDGPFKSSVD